MHDRLKANKGLITIVSAGGSLTSSEAELPHIGSTPNSLLRASMNLVISSVGGRA